MTRRAGLRMGVIVFDGVYHKCEELCRMRLGRHRRDDRLGPAAFVSPTPSSNQCQPPLELSTPVDSLSTRPENTDTGREAVGGNYRLATRRHTPGHGATVTVARTPALLQLAA
jgi:hypothetical protein